ncbi:MAG: acyl-CoA thioesterase [Ignavibacteriaceae bacterium]
MFTSKKKINFYDCDPAGIFFYGKVYELCHSAYEDLIASFNLDHDYWRNEDYVVPIIQSAASYHKPIKYGELINVEIIVSQLKLSSFELQYDCKNEKGENCTKVKTVHVFIDKKSWKKKEMRKEIYNSFSKYIYKEIKT